MNAKNRSLIGGALLLAGVLPATPLKAQRTDPPKGWTVNSTADTGDAYLLDQVCADSSGRCTLRAAIQNSNVFTGTQGISFNIPTTDPHYDPQTGSYTIGISAALPDLADDVNINGPGATKLLLTKLSSGSHLRIFNVTTGGTVNISGLTIFGAEPASGGNGGGIQNVNSGTVNVSNCILSKNTVRSDGSLVYVRGGAIFNASTGTVNITNSTLRFNRAEGWADEASFGGAIYNNSGTVNVTDSTLDHNSGVRGGGIYNETGVVTVLGSTFRENVAKWDGGGISNWDGSASITNSTFYANIASGGDGRGYGGAISNTSGTLNLTNSSLSANFSGAVGSGVYNGSNGTKYGVVNVKSSIIALNYGGRSANLAADQNFLPHESISEAPDVSGTFASQGFNLIGKKDGSTGFTQATDKTGTVTKPLNPKLDPRGLWSNGGSTQTIALQTGSPAVDKGTSVGLTGTLTTDQRGAGFARTVEKTVTNAAGGDGTDIGAFELP